MLDYGVWSDVRARMWNKGGYVEASFSGNKVRLRASRKTLSSDSGNPGELLLLPWIIWLLHRIIYDWANRWIFPKRQRSRPAFRLSAPLRAPKRNLIRWNEFIWASPAPIQTFLPIKQITHLARPNLLPLIFNLGLHYWYLH